MRIAVVMPRGSVMERDRANSMETVAVTLNAHSRFRADTRIFCDAGAVDPALPDLITTPAGLSKAARTDAMAERLRAFAPDLIEYHQQLGPAAELARRLPGPAHVLYRHTRIKPPAHFIERWRYRARLKSFDRLLFVSQAACDEFRADYPNFPGLVEAVCNPIDVEAWAGDVETREPLILFSGRAMPEKGLDAVCEALAVVLDRRPAWRAALMLGDWERHQAWAAPHVDALRRFGDRVEIHASAPLALVQATTRRAAIALTPSRVAEAMGLTALEAHAAGAALISSGRGGLREASGPHALYVDPPETPALTEALMRLVDDPGLRLDLARGGKAFVARTHAPAVRAAELDDLRRRLTAERPDRPGPVGYDPS